MTAAMTRTVAGETLPAAGTWTLDPSHSSVAFSVRHLVAPLGPGGLATLTDLLRAVRDASGARADGACPA